MRLEHARAIGSRPPSLVLAGSGVLERWCGGRFCAWAAAVVSSPQVLWLLFDVSLLILQDHLLCSMFVGLGVIGLRLSALSLPFLHNLW